MSVAVKLPDGSVRKYDQPVSVAEVAASISRGLAKRAIAGKVNGQVVDLSATVPDQAEVRVLTLDDPEGLEVYRHSTAHVMAQALKRLVSPDVKLGIGPVIEDGFYYDIDMDPPITPGGSCRKSRRRCKKSSRGLAHPRARWFPGRKRSASTRRSGTHKVGADPTICRKMK